MSAEQRPQRILHSRLGWVAFLASLQLAAVSAQAASEESRERAAKKACLAGDVAKGVAILAELYVRTEDPVFIFNQGRCFEQNGKYDEAIIRFREFLQKHQDAGHSSDPIAEKHIAKCQALLDSGGRKDKPSPGETRVTTGGQPSASAAAPTSTPAEAPTAAPPPPATPSPAPTTAPALGAAAGEVAASPEPAQQARPAISGAGLRVGGVVAMAAGVAGIATGIALNVKANSIASELETNRPYLRGREDTRAIYETWGWVGYGVGGVCLLGGAVLYYFGYSQGRSGQVALLPATQGGSFGATLQGVF
jgi:hypothetical protein